MYKAALDVFYKNDTAIAVCFMFREWTDTEPTHIYSKIIRDVTAYEPGYFYKRELPCILHVLQDVDINSIEVFIIDGYVYLDNDSALGLGGYLHKALQNKPVIGVAKSPFYNNTKNVVELLRGNSVRPLYITAVGMDLGEAVVNIRSMAGKYRMPHILKLLDRRTRI